MADGTRSELYAALQAQILAEVVAVNPALDPLEVDVFFADELLFASATRRNDDASIRWRSSHAATPDSHSIAHLAEAGRDLVARIIADAKLAEAVDGGPSA